MAHENYVELPIAKMVTLIYPQRGDKILLLQRKKWPFIGQWVAPGGKIECLESPKESAERELFEETGLRAGRTELRALVTETSQRPDWQWQIFVYRTVDPVGELCQEQPEGELRWFAPDELADLRIPAADRQFMKQVLGEQPGVFEYHFRYDDQLNII